MSDRSGQNESVAERESIHAVFADPPREFGMMPMWLWNDDVTEKEMLRQIHEFYAQGFGGFIPSVRNGFSRRVGYMTDEYWRLMRIAVEEAHKLGMKVILYDEASYPSGSAHGEVVKENPEYAARCLISVQRKITGPASGYWRPNPGRSMADKLLCVVLGRETASDILDPASLKLLTASEHQLVRYDVPEGDWRIVSVWEVFSGGKIRGAYPQEDDSEPLSPPAGDILSPDAVACFIRHTHDQYLKHLKEYFGNTVIGFFTDEPNPLGRGATRGPNPKAFSVGFLEDLRKRWDADVHLWLPALWLDCGPRTAEFRRTYESAIQDRLFKVFYAALGKWCGDHNIALTGHPAAHNEMGPLRYFQLPGQDTVWRWVLPTKKTRLEGPESVIPKSATSAAAIYDRRRTSSELFGAYGWRLTLDETKWLLDWHLARGNNLFYPRCLFSIQGRHAFEAEPDQCIHNVWRPYFGIIGNYMRRVCWLLADGLEICDVAILTDVNKMAWNASKELQPAQIDYLYIDDAALAKAKIESGRLAIGTQKFRAVICDPQDLVTTDELAKLMAFRDAGGLVIEKWEAGSLVGQLVKALGRDVDFPGWPDLRTIHYRKSRRDFYLFVNEEEDTIEGRLSLASTGSVELWDPLDGSTRPWPARVADARTQTYLRLERRQALVLAVDPSGEPQANMELPSVPGEVVAPIAGPWRALNASGSVINVPCPGDWAQERGYKTFSGTLRFLTDFEMPKGPKVPVLYLDMGRVGDIAEVLVNGEPVGVRAWAPYVLKIGHACRAGSNLLEIRVTNSMGNVLDGLQMPSGLMGPVVLREARKPEISLDGGTSKTPRL